LGAEIFHGWLKLPKLRRFFSMPDYHGLGLKYRISRSFSPSDKRPMLTNATSVEKRCARMNQPLVVQLPGGMSAHFTRDINKGLVSLHFLLEIPLDGVFTPNGYKYSIRS
jgi:hypothetical protein